MISFEFLIHNEMNLSHDNIRTTYELLQNQILSSQSLESMHFDRLWRFPAVFQIFGKDHFFTNKNLRKPTENHLEWFLDNTPHGKCFFQLNNLNPTNFYGLPS